MKTMLILFSVVFATQAGWNSENTGTTSPSLASFLPDQPGYRWAYWGFAEYGHWIQLDGISRVEGETIYSVTGMVEDMSEGEGQRDLSINLKYVVSDSALTLVQHTSLSCMDKDFRQLELLRLPLLAGSSWTQTAQDYNGEDIDLVCEIEEIEEGLVTVRYSQINSSFYQLRVFEEGIGVVTFEKLFISPEGNFEVGYTLFRDSY